MSPITFLSAIAMERFACAARTFQLNYNVIAAKHYTNHYNGPLFRSSRRATQSFNDFPRENHLYFPTIPTASINANAKQTSR